MPNSSPEADLVFLPWVRQGASAALDAPDTLGARQPASVGTVVTLQINGGNDVRVPVQLMGPGQVTGIDPRQVIRTDPARNARNFEPNYFPLVEFDDPSLPWLFTPASANSQARLRPWLVLVVVPRLRQGIQLRAAQGRPLPVLQIDAPAKVADELPDLADSWAWAHAQLAAAVGAGEETLRATLGGRPELNLSRLVCPRLLEPDTEYIACVVPAFEIGRKAGLGAPIEAADETRLEPAWKSGAAAPPHLELPVYHHWEFATGAGGDFESLALLLRPRPVPPQVGRRPIDISASSLALDPALEAGTALDVEGALQPVDAQPATWPPEARQGDFQVALAGVVNAPADEAARVPDGDPLVAPPLYAATQAARTRADVSAATTRWFEQLNLDPTRRAVAAFGTRVVQQHQEALMAGAWEQAAELDQVNRYLRYCQLGHAVGTRLYTRHLMRMTPDAGLLFTAPAHARLARSGPSDAPTAMLQQLRASGLGPDAFAGAVRRIARPRGAINRRLLRIDDRAEATGVRTVFLLQAMQPMALFQRFVPTARRLDFDAIGPQLAPPRSDILWNEATAQAIGGAPPRPGFAFLPLGQTAVGGLPPRPVILGATMSRQRIFDPDDPFGGHEPPEPEPPIDEPPLPHPRPRDSAAAATFRTVARAHLARFLPPPPPPPDSASATFTLQTLFAAVTARFVQGDVWVARASAVVQRPGPEREGLAALDPIGWAPQFVQPMSQPLAELSQDLLLPGLDAVLPNTVLPLVTNSRFVEAFMAGLNSEMARELLWRGFPSPLNATFFRRFWQATREDAPPDIEPIHQWGEAALGSAALGSSGPGGAGGERFVLLVRSELLRRYPNAIVYVRLNGPPVEERLPSFGGSLDPDVRFFGFDLRAADVRGNAIVIQEQPTAPRFGIEVADAVSGRTHLAATEPHAARIAERTRQMPVRVIIPAANLLPPS